MLKLALAGAVALAFLNQSEGDTGPRASGYFSGYMVPQPPLHRRGIAAADVFFLEQSGIDQVCGGEDDVVACASVGGGQMYLPNPCQPRFAGEAYAAVVCHEKGHILGWRHG